ncbi:MAG: leucine--tRNA ligase, partial [Gammaproteobacteria bacterium]|nr:leucine--tRNA ligase [Gammaproteobacteria bacterium]
LGHDTAIIDETWPSVDEAALVQDTIEMVIQVNGKLRGKMSISANAEKSECEALALENDQVRKFVGESAIRKVIVVPSKLVNIVI